MELTKFVLPIRAAQGTFSLIVLATTAYVTSWWGGYWRDMSPAEINFLVFASAFTFVALAYLVIAPSRAPQFAPKIAVLGVEGIAMTFWFGGFVALAVFLSSRICFGNVCNVAKASVVFAAFNWVLFAATTIISGLELMRWRSQPAMMKSEGEHVIVEDVHMKKGPLIGIKEIRDRLQ